MRGGYNMSIKNIGLRSPRIEVTFLTEAREYNLKYDDDNPDKSLVDKLKESLEEKEFGLKGDASSQGKVITDAIINLATQNDMSQDVGTFAITLVGTRKWDIALNSNDVVIIKINANTKVENPTIMVGMISEVKKIGEFQNNSAVYSITGLSMGKALMQMKLSTLQELSAIAGVGWLNTVKDAQDGETGQRGGLQFTGATASDVVKEILTFFLIGYAKYVFGKNTKGEKTLKDFITMDLSSRSDEKLVDPTPYMRFQGSLRQFISETQAKPYNEFYEDYTAKNQCKFIMRPTPFEEEDWNELPEIKINSSHVIEETVSKDDTDAYSVFNCSIPTDLYGTSPIYLSKPQTAKELIDKYGYSILEAENRYIYRTKLAPTGTGTSQSLDNSDTTPITSADVENIRMGDLSYTDKNMVTGKQLDDYVRKRKPSSIFNGLGDAFIEAGIASGLNPIYIFAHATLESAWGNSSMSYNFFGIGAFDNNPQNGHNYGNATPRDGIINGAKWIADNYYKKGQKSVYKMRHNNGVHQYATDPEWDIKIATQMANVYREIGYKFGGDKKSDKLVKNDATTDPNITNTVGDKLTVKEEEKNKNESTEKVDKDKEAVDELAKADNQARLGKYSKYLFNWYADNPSYYSGTIRVVGNPDYRPGQRLLRYDPKDKNTWEYYIEAVSHDFSYSGGYTTVLGVTRGLKQSQDRFKHHYTSEDFLGGYFGESSLEDLYAQAMADKDGGAGGDEIAGGGYEEDTQGDIYKVSYQSGWVGTLYAPEMNNKMEGGMITAIGTIPKNNRTCAVDPSVVAYGTVMAIKVPGRPELTRLWHAEDTGGMINGKHIDLCVSADYLRKKPMKGNIEVGFIRMGKGKDDAVSNVKNIDKIFSDIDKKYREQTVVSNSRIAQFCEKWRKPNAPSVYKWGGGHGDTPTNPFKRGGTLRLDCSGFTGWMLYDLGLKGWTTNNARYSTAAVQASMGTFFRTVSVNKGARSITSAEKLRILGNIAQPGDFLFFDWNKGTTITHVGVYMGTNKNGHYMVSCAGDPGTASSGIRIDSMQSGYWLDSFTGLVRRVKF